METLINTLKELSTETDLQKAVIADILDGVSTDEELTSYLSHLQRSGCASGMVNGLIYYADTDKFFDTHYDDIDDLRTDWEEQTGEPMKIGTPLKNWLAWFAYEETARNIANELEIEL